MPSRELCEQIACAGHRLRPVDAGHLVAFDQRRRAPDYRSRVRFVDWWRGLVEQTGAERLIENEVAARMNRDQFGEQAGRRVRGSEFNLECATAARPIDFRLQDCERAIEIE